MERLAGVDRELIIAAGVVLMLIGQALVLGALGYLKKRCNRY